MSEAAVVKYEPTAPARSAGNLKTLLEANSAALTALLPKHVTPERLIKTMLVAANRNPSLLLCTQASIFETISRAAELGLDLSGTLGEAYPVPYKKKNGDRYEMQCQLIPGYRGLAKLARQSGDVSRLEAEAVYSGDHFVYEKGSNFRLEFRQAMSGPRGDLLGFYAYCKFKDGGEQADFMTVDEVHKVRKLSKSGDKGPWVDHFEEMGKKTVFRRLAKWLPLSSEKFSQALDLDSEDYDLGNAVNVTKNVTPNVASRIALEAATSGEAAPEPEPEDAEEVPAEPEDAPPAMPLPAKPITAKSYELLVETANRCLGKDEGELWLRSHVTKKFKTKLDRLPEGRVDEVLADIDAYGSMS